MPRKKSLSLLAAAVVSLAACSSAVRKPTLLHPGPAAFQRANAEVIDPYPLPDMAPEIDGGRPREFDKPRNEVVRAQDFLRSSGARPRQEVPLAPLPAGPPTPLY